MSKIKRFLRVGMVVVLTFIMSFVAGGCLVDREFRGRFIETEQWQLFRFNNDRSSYRIVRLNDPSLIVDGVLTIPSYVGNRRITGFGGIEQTLAESIHFRHGQDVNKIVIPAGVAIDVNFWGTDDRSSPRPGQNWHARYVELLCPTGELITFEATSLIECGQGRFPGCPVGRIRWIIPTGSRNLYLERIIATRRSPDAIRIYERWEFEAGLINDDLWCEKF